METEVTEADEEEDTYSSDGTDSDADATGQQQVHPDDKAGITTTNHNNNTAVDSNIPIDTIQAVKKTAIYKQNIIHKKAHIREIIAIYAIDIHTDQLIFLRTERVVLEVEKKSDLSHMKLKLTREVYDREVNVATVMLESIRYLLGQGGRRGLSAKEAFSHFDTANVGYIDANMLLVGLQRLGMPLTLSVANKVIELLSRLTLPSSPSKRVNSATPPSLTVTWKSFQALGSLTGPLPSLQQEESPSDIGVSRRGTAGTAPSSSSSRPRSSSANPLPSSPDIINTGRLLPKSPLPITSTSSSSVRLGTRPLTTTTRLKPPLSATASASSSSPRANVDLNDFSYTRKNRRDIALARYKRSSTTPDTLPTTPTIPRRMKSIEHPTDLSNGQDKLHHCTETGCILTYRWLTHTKGHNSEPTSEIILVVLPDLFMTLDTLQSHLLPITDRISQVTLLLVGLLGLPNTCWVDTSTTSATGATTTATSKQGAEDAGITIETQVQSLHSLITYINTRGHNSDPPVKYIFIGFGYGALIVNQYLTSNLTLISHWKLNVLCIILINNIYKYLDDYRRICNDILSLLPTADDALIEEVLVTLHHSELYLKNRDLTDILHRYRTVLPHFRSPLGRVGIIDMLKGVLYSLSPTKITAFQAQQASLLYTTHSNITQNSNNNIPIVIVQSSENEFIHPRTLDFLYTTSDQDVSIKGVYKSVYDDSTANDALKCRIHTDITHALESNSVYLSWLQAGHGVLEERGPFILGLISTILRKAGVGEMERGQNYDHREGENQVFQHELGYFKGLVSMTDVAQVTTTGTAADTIDTTTGTRDVSLAVDAVVDIAAAKTPVDIMPLASPEVLATTAAAHFDQISEPPGPDLLVGPYVDEFESYNYVQVAEDRLRVKEGVSTSAALDPILTPPEVDPPISKLDSSIHQESSTPLPLPARPRSQTITSTINQSSLQAIDDVTKLKLEAQRAYFTEQAYQRLITDYIQTLELRLSERHRAVHQLSYTHNLATPTTALTATTLNPTHTTTTPNTTNSAYTDILHDAKALLHSYLYTRQYMIEQSINRFDLTLLLDKRDKEYIYLSEEISKARHIYNILGQNKVSILIIYIIYNIYYNVYINNFCVHTLR